MLTTNTTVTGFKAIYLQHTKQALGVKFKLTEMLLSVMFS